MSEQHDKLAGIPPLGRTAEEVEAESSNRANPPALHEAQPEDSRVADPLIVPLPRSDGTRADPREAGAPAAPPYAAGLVLGAEEDLDERHDNPDTRP